MDNSMLREAIWLDVSCEMRHVIHGAFTHMTPSKDGLRGDGYAFYFDGTELGHFHVTTSECSQRHAKYNFSGRYTTVPGPPAPDIFGSGEAFLDSSRSGEYQGTYVDSVNCKRVEFRGRMIIGAEMQGLLAMNASERQRFMGDFIQRHATGLGMRLGPIPTKIFLSHKGANKPMVRRYFDILKTLGFDPWLDEDAMKAGTPLDRAIMRGFEESCAVVFFVTPDFVDEKYLAMEIDYALQQETEKGPHMFKIITLVFNHGDQKPTVPKLLKRHVYKKPATDLEGLMEILHALPLSVGPVHWRK